ncbi:unnamed protein product [Nippostrongylus brasiliensis]|uniref:Peptidase A2 domain-containing protein n=1 Tax=Nippostrongylus brasiliensis TaxID=27835 RepID=A0A0N4YVM4_NIPBR|nr:unnamed protein product [Nippostrongylus brasiliensis]
MDDTTSTVLSSIEKERIPTLEKNSPHTEECNVFLLTGVAKVQDTLRKCCRTVDILLDTGADQSFISNDLANELGLEPKAEKQLKPYTFGAKTPEVTKCTTVTLAISDAHGVKHEMRLLTTPVLTAANRTAHLSTDDAKFIRRHNNQFSENKRRRSCKPQILLGCDQLWNLLDTALPQFNLPSGLKLIPSRLGDLLTGKQHRSQRGLEQEEKDTNPNVVSIINTFSNLDDDLIRWEKYWTMDSTGIGEFTGTKKAEKAAVNAQVEAFFRNTIERRDDGYYVRLP